MARSFAFTASGVCGGTISPTVQLQDGTANLGNLATTFTLGQVGTAFSQNFDSVTAPALPSGWSTSATGAAAAWNTTSSLADTPPNAAFTADAAAVGLNELVSASVALPLGAGQLTFRSYCDLEPGTNSTEAFDGGVLEIKVGTNSFTDILAAGGSFAANGYNRTISTLWGNPLGGRQAWSGHSTIYSNVIVNLPANAPGQTIQLRWRCGTDGDNLNGGGLGWRVDSIVISGPGCATNTPPVLPSQTGRTINELTTLTVTNTASDLESPPAGADLFASRLRQPTR